MKNKHIIAIVAVAILLVGVTAGATTYITRDVMSEDSAQKPVTRKSNNITWNSNNSAPVAQAQPLPKCDDGNIVGHVAGGVIGGIAGNQIGKGNGNTAATIGGAVGGAYLGGEYIPTKNVTCRQ